MRHQYYRIMLLVFALAVGIASQTGAGGGRCSHCGCAASCQKVCRLVREEKKEEIICWGCTCADFCVPGPSKPGCKHCETVCEECDKPCDPKTPYAAPKKFVWRDWVPGCARIYTKKKLMQKKVSVKVPSYKWVVEDLCSQCEAKCECANIQPGVAVPPPPVADAKLKYGGSASGVAAAGTRPF